MRTRPVAAFVTTCLYCCLAAAASAQSVVAPDLTRQQRDLLKAIVSAVDAAAAQPETAGVNWQSHILRASDGSHYIAFSLEPPASLPLPAGPAMLYIRLATAVPQGVQRIAERSMIREWLAGNRIDPRLLPNNKGIAIGEMPMMGAAGLNTVRPATSTGGNELKLLALERERARQEKEDQERQRRNELEGKAATTRELLPFEDYDLASRSTRADGTRIITRAFTAGPGDYDLFFGWADPAAPKAPIRVVRKSLSLEPARTVGLITSSVILADSVTVRTAPYPPTEQASHPYSIGLMEILPARSNRYAREQNLSVAFQIINAQSNDAGMPDLAVNFRIVRVTGDREAPVASLKPQIYNATTMPPDFNLKLGHPVFAAVTAPLASLARGDYRLKVQVNDRISNAVASTDTDFSILATPTSLLAEAPPLGPVFKRDVVLEPKTLSSIVDALAPAAPSPALARALATAKTGKLVDLLAEEPVPPTEAGIRTALTGLAYFSIGDASAAIHFQRALQPASALDAAGELRRGRQNAAIQFLIGAARAAQSRDPDAVAAWQAAIAAGNAPALTTQLLVEAHLRRNDPQQATQVLAAAGPAAPARLVAAAHIANRREAEAVALIDSHLASQPNDQEARWLLLHALYSQFVRSGQPLSASDAEKFKTHVRAYVEGKGVNAALAEEWGAALGSSK